MATGTYLRPIIFSTGLDPKLAHETQAKIFKPFAFWVEDKAFTGKHVAGELIGR